MKRLSFYTVFVPLNEESVLAYCSMTGAYIVLKSHLYDMLMDLKTHNTELETNHSKVYKQLCDLGYLIDEDTSELQSVQNLRIERRFSGRDYHVIINPTMDCNLKCWYCYEGHIPESEMTEDIMERFIKHLVLKQHTDPFKNLRLDLFGGEPLLKQDAVKKIVTRSKAVCDEYGASFNLSITTNGICLSDSILAFLRDYPTDFQITLDGTREKHDSVRFFKNSGHGSYERIIKNIYRIQEVLIDYNIRLRVNFDGKTLRGIKTVLEDLKGLNRQKAYIGLHKVWQVDEEEIDEREVFQFIADANASGFMVEYHPLYGTRSVMCYADNLNQICLNYNGDVYKCTAREFTPENREGTLQPDGTILWNIPQKLKRLAASIPAPCKECRILPSCSGPCSQKIIEGDDVGCVYKGGLSIEERVLINFRQQYFMNKGNFLREA